MSALALGVVDQYPSDQMMITQRGETMGEGRCVDWCRCRRLDCFAKPIGAVGSHHGLFGRRWAGKGYRPCFNHMPLPFVRIEMLTHQWRPKECGHGGGRSWRGQRASHGQSGLDRQYLAEEKRGKC